MEGIALLLAAAALAHLLARAGRVPPIPLLMLAGLVLSTTGLLRTALLEDTLVLGVTFLLFVTGTELGPRRTRAQRRAGYLVGVLQFVVLAIAGLAAGLALGYEPLDAAYLALALTASSTLVIVRLLQRRRQMFEPFARMVLGVLLLQNLLVIGLVPVVSRLGEGATASALGLLSALGLMAAAAATAKWLAPRLLRLDGDSERLLLTVLALLFVFIGAADALGLPLPAGAFLAGIALSGFPISGVIGTELRPIGDFFSAIFFTALGALIGFPTLTGLLHAALLTLLVLVATPPLVAFIAERAGFSARPSIEAGLLLAQTSELSLVVGLLGMLENLISPGVFTIIALVTVTTMVATPFVTSGRVAWALLRLHPVRAETHVAAPEGGHIVVLGSGTTGEPLLETLLSGGHEVVVVDDDPTVISRLREAEIPCIRADASDIEALERAHARKARLITSTIRRPEDNRRLLQYAGGVPVLVRVFDRSDAEWVRALGGTPVLYSEATAESMLRWFDRQIAPAASGAEVAPRPDNG